VNLLDITDLEPHGLRAVLDLSTRPIKKLGRPLDGQGVALVFEKPSNRTRQSMEVAVVQLGGHPVYTRGEEVGFDVREPVEDIARVMSGYHGLLAVRVFRHDVVVRLAEASSVPVVNMLSDHSHPLQGLADALTMLQEFGSLKGRTIAWVGDYNNVARSLGEVCAYLGAHLRFGCPDGYSVPDDDRQRFLDMGSPSVESSADPMAAVVGAHAVHTDTWVSMGQEDEKAERLAIFGGYTVTDSMMAEAASDAIFMHCLPAYRGLEVEASVIDGPRSRVIQQAHNRLHSARGAMAYVVGGG
jgi:ornithine carbamoyltransferase